MAVSERMEMVRTKIHKSPSECLDGNISEFDSVQNAVLFCQIQKPTMPFLLRKDFPSVPVKALSKIPPSDSSTLNRFRQKLHSKTQSFPFSENRTHHSECTCVYNWRLSSIVIIHCISKLLELLLDRKQIPSKSFIRGLLLRSLTLCQLNTL